MYVYVNAVCDILYAFIYDGLYIDYRGYIYYCLILYLILLTLRLTCSICIVILLVV